MAEGTVFWAGKRLDPGEEAQLRDAVRILRRCGDPEAAASYARFLPENDHRWSPDELELAAAAGPWVEVSAER